MQTANDNSEFTAQEISELNRIAAEWEINKKLTIHEALDRTRKITGYTSSGNGSAIPVYGEDSNGQS